jgi:hypothetical protein
MMVVQNQKHTEIGEATCIQLNNIEQKEVWELIPEAKVPAGRNIIGERWILAQKDDGCY